jgi:hypothetical protein
MPIVRDAVPYFIERSTGIKASVDNIAKDV